MKTIEVVAAVIFWEGKVLCVQRAEHEKEYVSLKWLAVEELDQLDWAAADVPIVERLKL